MGRQIRFQILEADQAALFQAVKGKLPNLVAVCERLDGEKPAVLQSIPEDLHGLGFTRSYHATLLDKIHTVQIGYGTTRWYVSQNRFPGIKVSYWPHWTMQLDGRIYHATQYWDDQSEPGFVAGKRIYEAYIRSIKKMFVYDKDTMVYRSAAAAALLRDRTREDKV
jgi:hypothetical protein